MITLEKILKTSVRYRGSYLGNTWKVPSVPSGQWEMSSPANGDWVLPPVSFAFDQAEEAVLTAQGALDRWKYRPLSERADLLKKFGEELTKRSDLLGRVISVEMGKIFDEALAEASLLSKKIEVTLSDGLELVRMRALEIPGQGRSEIHFRPKGVLVVIGPFNFPVHLSHGHIVPALLMGNVVILKPSEKVPYSAQIYAEAAEAAGFPSGVFQLVQGNHETATRLIRHTGVHGVLATCSLDVGVKIQKELAQNPEKLVALEMGGKNAAVVLPDASLDGTARALIQSSFLTTGQRCTALSRVYVATDMMDSLVQRVHELAKELVVTQPFEDEPKPFMGPLVSAYAKENFLRYSALAESEGAEAVMRPKSLEGVSRLNRKPIPRGHYVTPSIHRVKTWNSKSSYQSHEIFGPDLFFCPVKDLEESLLAVNASKYGLVASVFGGTREIFDYAADRIDCGLVYWNRPTVGASAKLPFGGWKASGNHRPAGLFAIYQATQAQARIIG